MKYSFAMKCILEQAVRKWCVCTTY